MIRTAQDVIDAARARGFTVKMRPGPPPMPYLVGKKDDATPALMAALAAFRPEIIDLLTPDTEPAITEESQPIAPMTDEEIPDKAPDGASVLFRAGDGTIKTKPLWEDS